jgi:hypothetical protein
VQLSLTYARYVDDGSTISFEIRLDYTPTAENHFTFTLPSTPNNAGAYTCTIFDDGGTDYYPGLAINTSTNVVTVQKYIEWTIDTWTVLVSGTYEK